MSDIIKESSGYFDGGYDTSGNHVLIEIVDKKAREGGTLSTIAFTEDNLEWGLVGDNIAGIMTTGEEIEDTLVWYEGTILIKISSRPEEQQAAYIEAAVDTYNIEDYQYGDQKEETHTLTFTVKEETTVGEWKYMRWRLANDTTAETRTFYCELLNESGEVVSTASLDVTGKIAHYYAMIGNVLDFEISSIDSAYIYDPIYPLPHDSRLNTAFDTPGYVTVGNKTIQLIDLRDDDVKDIDYDNFYYFFYEDESDGNTYTYMYDFYRKDFSLLNPSNYNDVDICVVLNPEGHEYMELLPMDLTFGIYDQGSSESSIEHAMVTYTEVAGSKTKPYYAEFTARWDGEQFNCKWQVKDYDGTVLKEGTATTYGPAGLYMRANKEIQQQKLFMSGFDTVIGTYSRWSPKTATEATKKFDWYRDMRLVIADDRKSFASMLQYGAGYAKLVSEIPQSNYYVTNGQVMVFRNELVPAGAWTFEWYDMYGNTIHTETYDETEEGVKKFTYVYVVREEREVRLVLAFVETEGTTTTTTYRTICRYNMLRSNWAAIKLNYSSTEAIPEDVYEPFTCYDSNAVMERYHAVDIAGADDYGVVKIDNSTIKFNSAGQIYSTGGSGGNSFMATYGQTSYSDIKAAYDAGKYIYAYVPGSSDTAEYYAVLGKYFEATGTFFFPTTTYEGYIVQYFCQEMTGWGDERQQVQSKLTAGTGITISDNVISATGGGGSYLAVQYDTTTFAEIKAAYDAGKPMFCVYEGETEYYIGALNYYYYNSEIDCGATFCGVGVGTDDNGHPVTSSVQMDIYYDEQSSSFIWQYHSHVISGTLFWAIYGQTPRADLYTQMNAGRLCVCRYNNYIYTCNYHSTNEQAPVMFYNYDGTTMRYVKCSGDTWESGEMETDYEDRIKSLEDEIKELKAAIEALK